jgi:hypothetical protein
MYSSVVYQYVRLLARASGIKDLYHRAYYFSKGVKRSQGIIYSLVLGVPIRLLWKLILILTLAIAVSVPILLVWLTAEERFPFSRKLDVASLGPNSPSPDICFAYFNLTDSGQLIASIYVQMDYPEPNSTGVPLYVSIRQQSETEIDSLTLGFSQYGYNGVSGLLSPSSSIPQDKFRSSTPHESWEMTANNLGSYGVGNITLDFVLYLGATYRVYDVLQYDVGLYIGLSMHQRALIQLTSLNADTYVDRFSGFYVRPP